MSKDIAIGIYSTKYWKTSFYDCDKLSPGIDLAVFDFGVHSGPARAKQFLDQASGKTPDEIIRSLCGARLAFLRRLSTWDVFGTGWSRRVAGIQAKAISMAKSPAPTEHKAGAVVAGGTVATMAVAPHLWPYLLAGTAIIIAGIILYKFLKKDNNVKLD